MKTLTITESLKNNVNLVWESISDLSRSDWVPGGMRFLWKRIPENFLCREWENKGENPFCDERNKVLKYSAIETPAEIKHHLACIELTESETGCDFSWSTEIDPEIYSSGVEQGMISSLEQLKKILDNQLP